MDDPTLQDGARSFYAFLSSAANLVPVIFALMSLGMCIYTGYNIWRMVQREGYGPADESMTGQIVGFCLAALLGITTVITYWVSSIFTGWWS